MLKVNKQILSHFTKEELIECILHTAWVFNPMDVLYRARVDKLTLKRKNLSVKIKSLISEMEGKNIVEQITLSKKIDKLYKKQDDIDKQIEKIYEEVRND